MLKNKIYNYLTKEIAKTFIIILFAFTTIAWTVRAVNFLDLVVENGHSVGTYFIFSLLNISNIITKFVPLSFLLAFVMIQIVFCEVLEVYHHSLLLKNFDKHQDVHFCIYL